MPESIVLGIETSCDETALAIVKNGKLLGQTLASQIDLHGIFGGVVPELASREHYRYFGNLLDELLNRCEISLMEIHCIAVARGPGLLGSLLVGNAFAKALALALGCKIIGINHLYAHFLAAGLTEKLVYPGLGLLVSGGHTHIYRINAPDDFIVLGRSIDDAAGEAYDKIGNVLGLSYPAGRSIDELAKQAASDSCQLPMPYLANQNLDFSFSGLKTAAINLIKERKLTINKDMIQIRDFCAALNKTIVNTLLEKVERAYLKNQDIRAFWLAGGVAANTCLRSGIKSLADKYDKTMILPKIAFCTDNAAMIAYTGWLLAKMGYYHNLDFEIIPRGRIIPEDLRKN